MLPSLFGLFGRAPYALPEPDSSDFRVWVDPRVFSPDFNDGDTIAGVVPNAAVTSSLLYGGVGTAAPSPVYRSAGPSSLEFAATYGTNTTCISNFSSFSGIIPNSDSATYFIVLDINMPAASSGEFHVLMDLTQGRLDTASRIQIALADPTVPTYGGLYFTRSGGGGLIRTLSVPSTGRVLITCEVNAGAAAIRVNGVEVATGSFGGGSSTANDSIDIGCLPGVPYYGGDRKYYQVIASDLLGSTLRDEWEAYLMAVYSI